MGFGARVWVEEVANRARALSRIPNWARWGRFASTGYCPPRHRTDYVPCRSHIVIPACPSLVGLLRRRLMARLWLRRAASLIVVVAVVLGCGPLHAQRHAADELTS